MLTEIWDSPTGKGLSLLGYIALSFYVINFLMVFLGIVIYFINLKADKNGERLMRNDKSEC